MASDRYTEVRAGKGGACILHGRVSRADAVREFRRLYEAQLREAQAALDMPGERLTVSTYRGLHVRRNEEPVNE